MQISTNFKKWQTIYYKKNYDLCELQKQHINGDDEKIKILLPDYPYSNDFMP